MRVLIISPHFPPVNAPDMQRVRMSLPAFVAAGWDVTVLTVTDPSPTAPVEPELVATVPDAVQVVRAFCFSRKWTAQFGVNNVALRSLPFLFLSGCRLLLDRRYDVVYFSTTMFITLPLGRLWKMFFRVPYVIDLQDPWVSDFYERPSSPRAPGGWKYRVVNRVGRSLEGWTMAGTSHLITVSADYVDTLRRRYPKLHQTPSTELPFGPPKFDLHQVAEKMKSSPAILPAGGLRLVFAGALGPGMLAAVEILFAAVAEVRRAGIPVSVYFYGTSYSPQSHGRAATDALASQYGISDCVQEQPDRLRYFDALQVTLEADANLLFGSTDLAFVPSKILTVLAAGRPVLAFAPTDSAMARRLAQLGQPCILFSSTGDNSTGISEAVAQLPSLIETQLPFSPPRALPHSHSAAFLAHQQLAIFASVSRSMQAETVQTI
jgi:hypothetical protein